MPIALFRHVASWLGCCLLCSACLRFGYAPDLRRQAGRSGTGAEMDAGGPRVSMDGGGSELPTAEADGGGDAGAYSNRMDASDAFDASASNAPPIAVDAAEPAPTPDAGQVIRDAGPTTPATDAAVSGSLDAALATADAGPPAPEAGAGSARVCAAGKQLGGYCWFLGEVKQSCNKVCAAHGGYESSLEWIGARAQGGTLARCDALLTLLLGSVADTTAGYRNDGRGVGCHLYDGGRWWLIAPDFSPAAYLSKTQIVCSCFDM